MRPKLIYTLLAGLILCLCMVSTSLAQDATVVRRAAFDIGSAAIKCIIADVDLSTGLIVKTVDTLSEKVDFAEDLARSYDGNLSKEVMAEGIQTLEKLKAVAVEKNALEYSAVGGRIFQKAQNGRAYFVRIRQETGIPSRVISEQQAAMLSYHAVRQELDDKTEDLLVWDIGGNSMHMTIRKPDGGLLFYIDPMASVACKNVVIRTIQKKDINTTASPNPVSAEEVAQALAYIRAHATITVPRYIADQVAHPGLTVAGIGGVHYYSVPEVLGGRKAVYTRDEVAAALKKWTGKSDKDFDSEYAESRLTNLILVLGYMDALGIKEVRPLKINQADGLFAAREFW
ncbi:putative exopolyphosphatase [Pseudodesulfovibrio mercurii]|uniref:Putative exopolyphosphatase n=1 Tax=Pseudodesulfovibrio mercurii TaxID=641491 RepID=F0JBU2_9BACT|nr:exopolyphosphatase [Pseudodesulfovibrio mercurii]EGB14335.1 putative exopolyphosphatase [Pseudodesulfovibrio mercurii]